MPRLDPILVSACLIGRPVRYDGTAKLSNDAILGRWIAEKRVVPICPEVSVGLPTPRPPAEIQPNPSSGVSGGEAETDGAALFDGSARVIENTGRDVTDLFIRAAEEAVALALSRNCRHAVLTDGSPSCGSSFIYDGTFSGRQVPGAGATATALRRAGITVWPETEIARLDALLRAAPQARD